MTLIFDRHAWPNVSTYEAWDTNIGIAEIAEALTSQSKKITYLISIRLSFNVSTFSLIRIFCVRMMTYHMRISKRPAFVLKRTPYKDTTKKVYINNDMKTLTIDENIDLFLLKYCYTEKLSLLNSVARLFCSGCPFY